MSDGYRKPCAPCGTLAGMVTPDCFRTSSCLVVMGVSACGKSSIGRRVAASLQGDFLDGDDLHSPENVADMAAGKPLTDTKRAGWLVAIHDAIVTHLNTSDRGFLVVACSALRRRYRDRLREGLASRVQFVHLTTDFATVLERLESRTRHFMQGRHMLEDQFAILEPLMPDELADGGMEVNASGQQRVIVDQIVRAAMSACRTGRGLQ